MRQSTGHDVEASTDYASQQATAAASRAPQNGPSWHTSTSVRVQSVGRRLRNSTGSEKPVRSRGRDSSRSASTEKHGEIIWRAGRWERRSDMAPVVNPRLVRAPHQRASMSRRKNATVERGRTCGRKLRHRHAVLQGREVEPGFMSFPNDRETRCGTPFAITGTDDPSREYRRWRIAPLPDLEKREQGQPHGRPCQIPPSQAVPALEAVMVSGPTARDCKATSAVPFAVVSPLWFSHQSRTSTTALPSRWALATTSPLDQVVST